MHAVTSCGEFPHHANIITMNITVCELHDDPVRLQADWARLVAHVQQMKSELVLLPEMPFHPWFAWTPDFDLAVWEAAVTAHQQWVQRLNELADAVVCGSIPATCQDRRRLNQGFVYTAASGYWPVHDKCYLPDEEGFWEASWYERGEVCFTPVEVNNLNLAFQICTELWFFRHARSFARQNVHLLLCPRATPETSVEKWVAGGRTAAVVSGAFCLSSNRAGEGFGGRGWVIEPEQGQVLALTSPASPFATVDIDLSVAEQAKQTYPRYVEDD